MQPPWLWPEPWHAIALAITIAVVMAAILLPFVVWLWYGD